MTVKTAQRNIREEIAHLIPHFKLMIIYNIVERVEEAAKESQTKKQNDERDCKMLPMQECALQV